jgi:hypothetical protein
MAMNPRLTVHIEKLVLHGFPAVQAQAIARSLERQLSWLLSKGDRPFAPNQEKDFYRLDGGSIYLPHNPDAQETGTVLARAVYGGLPR